MAIATTCVKESPSSTGAASSNAPLLIGWTSLVCPVPRQAITGRFAHRLSLVVATLQQRGFSAPWHAVCVLPRAMTMTSRTMQSMTGAAPGTEPAPEFRLGHRPGLDGLRGIAIVLVLAIHFGRFPTTYGFIGVDLFFALSGFLITCLLIEEWQRSHNISLRSFYARRALRLLPALGGLLIVFIVYGIIFDRHAGMLKSDIKEAAIALFYFTNWVLAFNLSYIDFLQHTWSLSIEEQFYIIWPAVLLFLLKKASPRTILYLVIGGAAASWLTRVLLTAWGHADLNRVNNGLDTRADALLLGCAMGVAICFGLVPRGAVAMVRLRYAAAISAIALAVIGYTLPASQLMMICVGWFLVSLFSAVIVLHVTAGAGTILHQILEHRILVFLGQLSYGLYIWHYPVMRGIMRQERVYHVNPPDVLFVTLICALLSYFLLEQPCLRLKKRFQRAGETTLPVAGIEPIAARA